MSKKNTIYAAFSLVLLITLIPACDWFKSKTHDAATAITDAVQGPKLHILDVNSAEIYADAHIPGAINVSFDNVEETVKNWNKKTPVVVYCSSYECGESHRVAKKLKDAGFEDVAVYAGGIQEWHKLGKENKAAHPVEGEAKQAFLEKNVAKTEPKEEAGIRTITAADLSKQIEAAKAPEVAPATEQKAEQPAAAPAEQKA